MSTTSPPLHPAAAFPDTPAPLIEDPVIFADAWPDETPRAIPTGETFSCVRVADEHAEAALVQIIEGFGFSDYLGPVIADRDQVYFVVRPDSDDEAWPEIATYHGRGCFVTIPAPQSTADTSRGVRWLLSPKETRGRSFADNEVLRTALEAVDHELFCTCPRS